MAKSLKLYEMHSFSTSSNSRHHTIMLNADVPKCYRTLKVDICNKLYNDLFSTQLENVAINDVLPLKAARRDAIANLKCFGGLGHQILISMVTFTFTMRRHLIRLASAPFLPIWQRLFGFDFRMQRVGSSMQNLRKAGEKFDRILSRL